MDESIYINFRETEQRKKLIDKLNKAGINNKAVLKAMETVPRHLFIDLAFRAFAYKDYAFPIAADQCVSQPSTVAFQTSLLEIKKTDKVLEIGTGSGYQTAILCQIGANVYTIERQKQLYNFAKTLLSVLGYQAKCYYGDGFGGIPSHAPFDKIIVTAGATEIPPELLNQLKTGGIIVIPVGNKERRIMKKLIKGKENNHVITEHGEFR